MSSEVSRSCKERVLPAQVHTFTMKGGRDQKAFTVKNLSVSKDFTLLTGNSKIIVIPSSQCLAVTC